MDTKLLILAILILLGLLFLGWNLIQAYRMKEPRPKVVKQRKQKNPTEILYLRSLIAELMHRNQELTNLVLAKDPQTFSALQATTTVIPNSSTNSPYIPTGTDVDEVNKQRIAEGLQPIDLSEFLGEGYVG